MIKKDKIETFLNTLLKLTGMVGMLYIFMIFSSCEDDIYIAGYNKDLEPINWSEIDTLEWKRLEP